MEAFNIYNAKDVFNEKIESKQKIAGYVSSIIGYICSNYCAERTNVIKLAFLN
jgi:hypothetical protein